MTTEQARQLFRQYLDDTISPDDYLQFRIWAADPANQPAFDEMILQAMQHLPAGGAEHLHLDTLYNELLQREEMQDLAILPPARPMWRNWWAAAAVLAGLLVAGTYLLLERIPKADIAAVPSPISTDIAPGVNKATLTLADGSTVTLDSAESRTIQQGGAAISQHKGQLLYAAGHTGPDSYNILATPAGGQFRVTLPDGSKVWLNSASSLRYPIAFKGAERIVELKGQGYFEIAKDARRPFKVRVPARQNGKDYMEVQVLGTRFDIMAYTDEQHIHTTLLEGAVRVQQGATNATLSPGQQAVLGYTDHALTVQMADVNQVIAWKTGFFEFANTDLAAIMRQIARWYDVEVEYRNTHSKERFLGRIGRDQPLSGILHLLEENGVRFTVEGKKVIVQ
ncbi:FecR family protein [Chitinophaga agrisoli]|uniref:FecR family protein n=1 Tax=Chitinophaga agrisoli TaxID=2607653 RepID=A0A5B2VQU0_9BACT|nr:FecR family protein [Chitinophaga agrisoli]KAA2240756.1 FecR family protein [Chitinophaga agrisoli]